MRFLYLLLLPLLGALFISNLAHASPVEICYISGSGNTSNWKINGGAQQNYTYTANYIAQNQLAPIGPKLTDNTGACFQYDTLSGSQDDACIPAERLEQHSFPYPTGWYVKSVTFNRHDYGTQCLTDSERSISSSVVRPMVTLAKFPVNSPQYVDSCFYPHTWLQVPPDWVQGAISSTDDSSCGDGDLTHYFYIADDGFSPKVRIYSANYAATYSELWCVSTDTLPPTNFNPIVHSTDLPAGYIATTSSSSTCTNTLGTFENITGTYTLSAIGSQTSFYTCAKAYASAGGVIPKDFVIDDAPTAPPGYGCNYPDNYFHVIKPAGSSESAICAAYGRDGSGPGYSAPAEWVIKNKRLLDNCLAGNGSTSWGYDITKATGQQITNVCTESFQNGATLPTGYVWLGGGGSGSNCSFTVKPVSGSSTIWACMTQFMSPPAGWIPIELKGNDLADCGNVIGAKSVTLKPAEPGDFINWIARPGLVMPAGYVIVPGVQAGCWATGGCFKIDLPDDVDYVCSDSPVPAGYQTLGTPVTDSSCGIGTKIQFGIKLPPNDKPKPTVPYNATETDLTAKPASMPAITY